MNRQLCLLPLLSIFLILPLFLLLLPQYEFHSPDLSFLLFISFLIGCVADKESFSAVPESSGLGGGVGEERVRQVRS